VPLAALLALAATTCATSSTAAKYPRRKPSCAIRIIHEAVPPVAEWDDIGMVEVGCYLDEGPGTCLTRLKAEGCRMGGDMIYDVPKKAARPTERALVYRGHVAHTKTSKPEPHEEPAASGPVVPLAPVPIVEDAGVPDAEAVPATADGGAADATPTP